jgi:hypothetical protein
MTGHFLIFTFALMYRKKPDVDVILDIMNAVLEANPSSVFTKSLWQQYQERGGLSKKQLQGLYGKASRLPSVPPHKLATLEAEILKRPTRYKSDKPPITPLYEKDEKAGKMIETILVKYPQHKRVLYFKMKWDNNVPLSSTELSELEKFYKALA